MPEVTTASAPTPKVIRRRTEAVVISPKQTLYDPTVEYEIKDTLDDKVMFDANVAAQQEIANASFSWEQPVPEAPKPPPPPPEEPIEHLLKDAEEDAKRYVVVENITKASSAPPPAPPKTFGLSTLGDLLLFVFFGVALLVGLKTGYDYVQESESFKRMANQLELENASDLTEKEKQDLADWGIGDEDAASITKRNIFRSGALSSIPGGNDTLVKIINTKPYYLLAQRKDGQIELRTGGTVGWRANNPGEFGWGDFSKQTGAIGKYSKYAIYPNMKAGMAAVQVYLFNTNLYSKLSINDAMKKFYADDKDKAESVAREISRVLNVSRARTKMNSLSTSQKKKVLNVIEKREKQLAGISRVFKNMKEFEKKGF